MFDKVKSVLATLAKPFGFNMLMLIVGIFGGGAILGYMTDNTAEANLAAIGEVLLAAVVTAVTIYAKKEEKANQKANTSGEAADMTSTETTEVYDKYADLFNALAASELNDKLIALKHNIEILRRILDSTKATFRLDGTICIVSAPNYTGVHDTYDYAYVSKGELTAMNSTTIPGGVAVSGDIGALRRIFRDVLRESCDMAKTMEAILLEKIGESTQLKSSEPAEWDATNEFTNMSVALIIPQYNNKL